MAHTATFIESTHEYDDVHSFWFDAPTLTYAAGQHVHVQPGSAWQPWMLRELSFASAPYEDRLRFTVHTGSGSRFKQALQHLAPGDAVRVFRTGGPLALPASDEDTPTIMIGGGVGVAPFRSLALEAARTGAHVRLLQVQRGPFLYADEFASFAGEHRPVRPEEFLAHVSELARVPHARYLLSGSKRLLRAARAALASGGVHPQRIVIESFG